MGDVVNLHQGDPRVGELYGAILDVIEDRGSTLNFCTVLGCLELVKINLTNAQIEAIAEGSE